MKAPADVSLITGFPSFTSRRVVRELLARDAKERVNVLVFSDKKKLAEEFVLSLTPAERKRVAIVEGDVAAMDLGITGAEFKRLTAEVTAIHHTAHLYHLEARRDRVERVNVLGAKHVLEFAVECDKLRRLVHWSTAQVSGNRTGVVLEEELDAGQRFGNVFEETMFRAEKSIADAKSRLPITIVRPSVIVGDSVTGEIDTFAGPYHLIALIVASPFDMRLPLPARGEAPLNLVPIDFVARAAIALGKDERAKGRTFHLTDPSPFSARTVYELVARSAERKAPRGMIPTGWARALLKAPVFDRIAKAPKSVLDTFAQQPFYNCRGTLALLDETDVRCPSFDAYVDPLVRYVREVHSDRRKRREEESSDPLD